MTPKKFESMVEDTCQSFSKRHGIKVSDQARLAIVTPGLPHLDDVTAALESKQISEELLSDSVQSILTNALLYAIEIKQDFIGENAVRESMKRNCPYLFWC